MLIKNHFNISRLTLFTSFITIAFVLSFFYFESSALFFSLAILSTFSLLLSMPKASSTQNTASTSSLHYNQHIPLIKAPEINVPNLPNPRPISSTLSQSTQNLLSQIEKHRKQSEAAQAALKRMNNTQRDKTRLIPNSNDHLLSLIEKQRKDRANHLAQMPPHILSRDFERPLIHPTPTHSQNNQAILKHQDLLRDLGLTNAELKLSSCEKVIQAIENYYPDLIDILQQDQKLQCPITHRLIQNPVVHLNNRPQTYEKDENIAAPVEEDFSYKIRLLEKLEHHKEKQYRELSNILTTLGYKPEELKSELLKSGCQDILIRLQEQHPTIYKKIDGDSESTLLCPISQSLIQTPTVISQKIVDKKTLLEKTVYEKTVFERESIRKWVQKKETNPITRAKVKIVSLKDVQSYKRRLLTVIGTQLELQNSLQPRTYS